MPEDLRFALPAIDDPPSTETGVILLGLDAERLLAGLGIAAQTGEPDPTRVTLLVDLARHGVPDTAPELDAAVDAGTHRWRSARPTLAAACAEVAPSAALRQSWAQVYRTLANTGMAEPGSAEHAYLTACWLRRHEIDHHVDGRPPPS